MLPTSPQRILLCGHRAFAAHGCDEYLRGQGHTVTCFSRGTVGQVGSVVTGPVKAILDNPHLAGSYDTVINYILLKDDTIAQNEAYLAALMAFCQARGIGHLIHISSVSVYKATTSLVHEDAKVEINPAKKGSYGSLKVATDQYLLQHLPEGMTLTLVRPGFILGEGLIDPIVGMAFRSPWNRLLVLGNPQNRVPMTTRNLVSRAVAVIAAHPPQGRVETVILVDKASPTRREYLSHLCTHAGYGCSVQSFPIWLWRLAGWGGECIARLAGMTISPNRIIETACRRQLFDATRSQQRLGFDLGVDWKTDLISSLDKQQPNFTLPYTPQPLGQLHVRHVAYLGYGRIVRTAHRQALVKLGFQGQVAAYDIQAQTAGDGQGVQALSAARLGDEDLVVVASPGPAHIEALPVLEAVKGAVLVEKPLGYTEADIDAWVAFAAGRAAPVSVCHNYRFKRNVTAMLSHLAHYNPGPLRHVFVHFQSPPVANDSAVWLRNERKANTLLLDYSLHFLDLACMFSKAPWDVRTIRHQLNSRGETDLISGTFASEAYDVSFLLRQGAAPRRTRLQFVFQNYSVSLGFFPETFVPYMADDNPYLYILESNALRRATMTKIWERIFSKNKDESHARAYLAALDENSDGGASIRVEALQPFYRLLMALRSMVYDVPRKDVGHGVS